MIEIANLDEDTSVPSNTYELRYRAPAQRRVRWPLHPPGPPDQADRQYHGQIVNTTGVTIPGLHVETYAFRGIETTMAHPDAVTAVLDAAVGLLAGDYMDFTNFDQISDKIPEYERVFARQTLSRVAEDAHWALALAQDGDEHGAFVIWYDLFGQNLPPGRRDAQAVISKLFNCGSVIGGLTTAARPTRAANPNRSWRP